jgi:hypothetical protein
MQIEFGEISTIKNNTYELLYKNSERNPRTGSGY